MHGYTEENENNNPANTCDSARDWQQWVTGKLNFQTSKEE